MVQNCVILKGPVVYPPKWASNVCHPKMADVFLNGLVVYHPKWASTVYHLK